MFLEFLMMQLDFTLLVVGYFTLQQESYLIGGVFVLIILMYIFNLIFRLMRGFTVTNNKDCILNIIVSEMPLFKNETAILNNLSDKKYSA